MAFATVNPDQLLHHGSPHYMRVALQTFSAVFAPTATAKHTLGTVLCKLRSAITEVTVNASAAPASGESLALSLKAIDTSGTVTTLGTVTLNSTKVPAAGSYTLTLSSTTTAPSTGAVLFLEGTYTAGGTPAAPTIAVIVQAT